MALQCQIVHAIAGRARLRLPALRSHPPLATQLMSYLRAQPGIVAVSVTPACDSLVVHMEPARWSAEALRQCLTALSLDTVDASDAQHVPVLPALPAPEPSWWAVGLASGAVVVSLLAEPLLPLLAPLLLGSAWPLLSRACTALTQGRFFTTDVADATATALLAWQGQWLASASLVGLIHATDALRDTAQRQAAQELAHARPTAPDGAWAHTQSPGLAETQAQHDAERWAEALLPGRAALAGAVGLSSGDAGQAAAVLMVGHRAGLQSTAPVTVLAAMARAARQGILIRCGRYLEALARVDALVFDTTVPLTQGRPEVARVISYRHQFSSDDILALAASLEQSNPHPVAQAIVWEAEARALDLPICSSLSSPSGLNVEAVVDGTTFVAVGTERFMAQQAITLMPRVQRDTQRLAQRDGQALYVAVAGRLCGLVAYVDPLRSDLAEIMRACQVHGMRDVVVLTEEPAPLAWQDATARDLVRFDTVLSPEESAAVVHRLHAAGRTVAVVSQASAAKGWWPKDAVPVTLQDDLASHQSAPVTVAEGRLAQLPQAVGLAREAMHLLQQHWQVLAGANTLALGLASLQVIGPFGALVLSKGAALAALGQTFLRQPSYARSRGESHGDNVLPA